MPKQNDAALVQQEANRQNEKKYQTKKLLKSRHLSAYQQDFARVVLKEPEYTISEAKAALDKALKGGS